ncbi:PREDICTED: transcription factor bHLH103 isoform X2 [Tarenaya hassleriana]|uniref:transcription factor bHLH103 isoform X2 n=1 Tax=Tarenaya hassleriana TaxID=28532 RepID=UPI00053C2941|nr:PREDICTED: transcription factor bHLH103 isoform X2 [Tarenaya hassleriana]
MQTSNEKPLKHNTRAWWSSSEDMFSGCSLPRASEIGIDVGSFAWQNLDLLDVKYDRDLDSVLGLPSHAASPPDWYQSIIHSEGSVEAKFNQNSFFDGLFEPHDEQQLSSWPRIDPILDSRVTDEKPELLDGVAFFDNVLFDDSGAVSVFHDVDIRAKSEEDHQDCKTITSKRTGENIEDFEGYDDGFSRLKRPRIDTPSPLPSFRVRNEKLGDRITALQQLVSPFGKNDTASVLNEAVEYIKFLHGQVAVLSNPYMKSGASVHQVQQSSDKTASQREDLRRRGLCLMPISSTFLVASQMNPSDFWNLPFCVNFK